MLGIGLPTRLNCRGQSRHRATVAPRRGRAECNSQPRFFFNLVVAMPGQRAVYNPTPKEIRLACEAIRRGWPEGECIKRMTGLTKPEYRETQHVEAYEFSDPDMDIETGVTERQLIANA